LKYAHPASYPPKTQTLFLSPAPSYAPFHNRWKRNDWLANSPNAFRQVPFFIHSFRRPGRNCPRRALAGSESMASVRPNFRLASSLRHSRMTPSVCLFALLAEFCLSCSLHGVFLPSYLWEPGFLRTPAKVGHFTHVPAPLSPQY